VNTDVVPVRVREDTRRWTCRVIDRPRIRALVADHDRWTRLSVSDLLGDAGFAVDEASNGMAALRLAAADPPQIVLIGHDLPEVSAADVAETLRSDPRTRHTAVVQVRDFADPIELLAAVLSSLEATREGRVHERPQTGTRQANPTRVSPQRSHPLSVPVRAFRSACVLPSADN
jgi:CheY-like chemotaxis protein